MYELQQWSKNDSHVWYGEIPRPTKAKRTECDLGTYFGKPPDIKYEKRARIRNSIRRSPQDPGSGDLKIHEQFSHKYILNYHKVFIEIGAVVLTR